MPEEKSSRRGYLKYAGAGIVVVAVAGAGAYYGSRPSQPTATATATQIATVTETIPTTLPPTTKEEPPFTGTLQLTAWESAPDEQRRLSDKFEELYGFPVDITQVGYAGYPAAVQSKIMGGGQIDVCMMYLRSQLAWYNAGWLRTLEGLEGVEDVKKDFVSDIWLKRQSEPDTGAFLTMPYWVGTYTDAYNIRMAEEWGLEAPTSLDDIYNQCKIAKSKGLDAPYEAYWSVGFEEFFTYYMVGEGVELFDEEGRPMWEGNQAFKDVLKWMKTMYEEKLTAPTILTDDIPQVVAVVNGGQCYYTSWHSYWTSAYTRQTGGLSPDGTPEKGNFRIIGIPPNSTHQTIAIGDSHGLMANNQNDDAAWKLIRFMGAKEPKTGSYEWQNVWFDMFGTMAPYKGFLAQQSVIDSLKEFYQSPTAPDDLGYQFDNCHPVNWRQNIVWYDEYNIFMEDTVKKMIVGQENLDDVPKKLADKAREIAKERGT